MSFVRKLLSILKNNWSIWKIHHWCSYTYYPAYSWFNDFQIPFWFVLFKRITVNLHEIVHTLIQLSIGCLNINIQNSGYDIVLSCNSLLFTCFKLFLLFFLKLMRNQVFYRALYKGCAYLSYVCSNSVRLLHLWSKTFLMNSCPDSKKADRICSKIFSFIFNYVKTELKQGNYVIHHYLALFRLF